MDESLSKNIRDDLILFKNETLRDLKDAEKLLLEKYGNLEFTIIEKIENFNKQFQKFNQKINEVSTFIDNLKEVQNNINILMVFKSKSENSLIDLRIKLKNLEKDSLNSFFNIGNVLKNSVIYPGVIGGSSKFKTFHELIDYTLSNISQYNQFKDKITKEVNNNKNNLDNKIDSLRNHVEIYLDKTQTLVTNEINSSEEKIQSLLKLYDEKMQNIKSENGKNDMIIKKQIEELIINFKEQISEIKEKKKDLFLKYNDLNEKNNQNNNEINNLRENYYKLSNIILDINDQIENINSINNLNNINNEIEIDNRDNRVNNKNKKRDSFSKSLFRILSANNYDLKKSKHKKIERSYRDNINIDKFQNLRNKGNYKTIETNKNNNNENEENNKASNFWGKSQSYKRFSLFKKNENIFKSKSKKDNININNISEPDYVKSQKNIIIINKKENDDSFKLKTNNNVSDKSTYVNLNSNNNNFLKTNQFKNISLNLDGSDEMYIKENNNKKNTKMKKNILQNNSNINININTNEMKKTKKNKYISGFPRIITNQGERIIISSHPVYHRHKFTNNFNPNIFLTFKNNHNNILQKKGNNINSNINKNVNININDTKNQRKDSDENSYFDLYNNNVFITSNNDDSFSNNFFKTLSSPNKIKSKNKKEYNFIKERNNSEQNYKKNKK